MDRHLNIIYENKLDTDKFARMFNNKAQSYKFYWFEAILNLTKMSDEDLSFEDIIDEMICEAWHKLIDRENIVIEDYYYSLTVYMKIKTFLGTLELKRFYPE